MRARVVRQSRRGGWRTPGTARFLLLLAAGSVACRDSTPPPPTLDYGFLVLDAMAGDVAYHMQPTAIFYRTGGLLIPTSRITQDSCLVLPVQVPPGPGTVTSLEAGETVSLAVEGSAFELVKFVANGLTYYAHPDTTVVYTPGDSVVFDVPGASGGFPRATIRAMTAEAFTLDPVGVPAAGDPISLSWTPAVRPGSKMTISLRYATPGSATVNQQIRCQLIDDGAHAIPAALASGWRNAHAGNRNALASRLRTSEIEPPGAALQVSSTFSVPTPQLIP